MTEGAYILLTSMLDSLESEICLTFADGTQKTIKIDIDKLKSELASDRYLDKQADWLADELIEHGHIIGTPADSAEELIGQWREAARKAAGVP